jgi:hypothetical protein
MTSAYNSSIRNNIYQSTQRGNDLSRNYSSNGGQKRHKGAREEMTSPGTIIQVSGTRGIKVPERK